MSLVGQSLPAAGEQRAALVWALVMLALLTIAIVVGWACAASFAKNQPALGTGDWFGYWGLVVGTVGVAVSILGFAFGLAELTKTRTTAEAARNAAEHVTRAYSALDSAGFVEAARSAAKRAAHHLTGTHYQLLAEEYDAIRANLCRVGFAPGALSTVTRERLKDLAGQALELYLVAAQLAPGEEAILDINTGRRWLKSLDDMLTEVDVELRSELPK